MRKLNEEQHEALRTYAFGLKLSSGGLSLGTFFSEIQEQERRKCLAIGIPRRAVRAVEKHYRVKGIYTRSDMLTAFAIGVGAGVAFVVSVAHWSL